MMNDEMIWMDQPYKFDRNKKKDLLTKRLKYLTKYHSDNCAQYKQILDTINYNEAEVDTYEQIPFLPVRIFKERNLKSVPDEAVIKTMTSSGTTGQTVSKIYLDKITAANQQKALVKIVSDFTGSSRMPMIIIDCPSVVKNRAMFSARGAGILGFSIFGSKKMYALDDDMNLKFTELREFIEKYKDRKILLFGFTFMIWQYFYKELVNLKNDTGEQLDLSNAILIHGGGWKKLTSEAISTEEFKNRMTDVCGLSDIHDYYGMVEQTGCIYMQCECGHYHASNYSDILIRDPQDFSICPHGTKGMIQVVSCIPESYPGHSLLTEDEGVVIGEDDCPCGRKGKYFHVLGRLKHAEIRGCSDTYAASCDAKQKMTDADTKDGVYQKMTYLLGDMSLLKNIKNVPPMKPFSEKTLAFFQDVSKEMMSDKDCRMYSDVVTLGFWLRRASMDLLKKKYLKDTDEMKKIGRGVAFHIAPSNVPVNFAYTLFTGLLTGNANVVRVPSKPFPQVELIIRAIKKVLEQHMWIRSYMILVQYERDRAVNDLLSSLCDIRVIWGGDTTINEIRKSSLAPRATEITFADRYSLAVIDSDFYLEHEDKNRIARDFYNDTYLSDQNACTSPRVVVWTGNRANEAKKVFWSTLHTLVKDKYRMQDVQSVNKLVMICMAASADTIENVGVVQEIAHEDNLIIRLKTDALMPALMKYRGNSGYFYEYDCSDLMELRTFCDDIHCQTLGYIGQSEKFDALLRSGIRGVDRIVPIGHTMDFDLVWDGYNLLDSMTREITIS